MQQAIHLLRLQFHSSLHCMTVGMKEKKDILGGCFFQHLRMLSLRMRVRSWLRPFSGRSVKGDLAIAH